MRKDDVLEQWKTVRENVLALYEETEEADENLFHTIPEGFPNSLHWQFGHLAATAEMVSVTVFEHDDEVSQRFNRYFGYGTSPENFDDDTPTMDDVHQMLDTQITAFIDDLTEEHVNQAMPENKFGAKDKGQFMEFFAKHEEEHVAKIKEMKSVLVAKAAE